MDATPCFPAYTLFGPSRRSKAWADHPRRCGQRNEVLRFVAPRRIRQAVVEVVEVVDGPVQRRRLLRGAGAQAEGEVGAAAALGVLRVVALYAGCAYSF